MRRVFVNVLTAIALALAASAIFWAAGRDFGMREASEFYPYDQTVKTDTGRTVRSSGVVVLINEREAFSTDREIAALMMSAKEMYPTDCSGPNWEIAIRRPLPDGGEEKYSFYSSIYEIGGPGSWIEYGRWTDGVYTVIYSYPADWDEVVQIADGRSPGFTVEAR
jgi:hypothetical protein